MKFLKSVIVFSLLVSSIGLVQAKGGYNIKVKVAGVQDTNCFLAYYYGDKQYIKDTVDVNSKGEFTFKGEDTLGGGIYLIVMPDKQYFEVIVNQNSSFSIETDTSDFTGKMKVKGSQENSLFYEYLNYIQNKHKEVAPLRTLLKGVTDNADSTALLKKQISNVDKDVNKYKRDLREKYPETLMAKIFTASEEIVVPDPPVREDGSIDSSFQFKYYKKHYYIKI